MGFRLTSQEIIDYGMGGPVATGNMVPAHRGGRDHSAGRDVVAAMASLAELVLDQPGAGPLLEQLAHAGATAIAGVSCASVAVSGADGGFIVAGTDQVARRLDEAQLMAARGPCVEAMQTGQEITVSELPVGRWPAFTMLAHQEGIGSVLSIPMRTAEVSGSVSLYGPRGLFADPAGREATRKVIRCCAALLTVSHRYGQAVQRSAHLERAMESRAVIEQAKGVIMVQAHCSPDQAFAVLTRTSKRSHLKVREIAKSVVAHAAGKGVSR